MDKFVIVKCINPGFIPPKEEEPKKEEPKKNEEPKKEEIKLETTKKKTTSKSKSTNNTTFTNLSSSSLSSSLSLSNGTNNDEKKGLAATISPIVTETKKPQQTLVSHFFTVNTGDKPAYKFLFEKEAADRAEEERKRAERIAKEEAILAEKKKQIQKAKLEAKKKREAERRKREEEEWEEYLALQEKTTKGIEIIPHLYLGSFLAAKNSEWLLEANITKIVNVTSEVPSYFLSKKEKENDKIISEKDEIDSFIVDDDDEEEEDIEEEDEEEEEEEDDDDEEDGDNEENEENKENEENVDIGDGNEKENKKDEKDKMKEDKQITNDKKDQEMKDLPTSSNENKEENIEMDDVSTTEVTKTTTTTTTEATAITTTISSSNESLTTINTSIKIDQVNEDVDSEKIKELKIRYLRISIADSFRSKIENHFQEAINFINEGNEKSNVLIHCKQGRSRSPSIVIAYLMSNGKWTLEKSFNHVSSVSPKNLTVNDGFKKKLMDLEMELFGSNSINFFDRSNRSSRASISSAAISQKRNNQKSKDKTANKENEYNKNEENIVDVTAAVLSTNLEVEDDASTIDQLKVVKRRKNISIVEDDDE
ncbi:hypothetical protein ACTA71_003550 [Dictyostelium dimigraforme]